MNDAIQGKHPAKTVNLREEILVYYNNDRGLVISAIQEAEKRAQRAKEEANRFEVLRQVYFSLCRDLLMELWNLEKEGIQKYDKVASCGVILTQKEGAEAWSLITNHGDSLTVYSSPAQPCRVTWTFERQVIREAVIMDDTGVVLSNYDTINAFMDIASEFMNSFIANNNIGC